MAAPVPLDSGVMADSLPRASFVVLPLDREQGDVLDACLGAALGRSLERKLGAAGCRVVPTRTGTRACEALGLDTPLDEEDARAVARHSGVSHVIQGSFERDAGRLVLSLQLCIPAPEGAAPDAAAPEPVRLEAVGELANFQDVLERLARELLERARVPLPADLGQARETGSFDAFLALARAQAALLQGDVASAEDEIASAIRLDARYVDPHEVAANAAREIGDTERGLDSLREVVRLHREAARPALEATALLTLGDALVDAGRWDEGTRSYEDAAAIWEKAQDVRGVIQARSSVANVHLRRGDHARAIEEYTAGLARLQALGGASPLAAGSPYLEDAAKLAYNLGAAHKFAGQLPEAARRFEESRRLGVEARDEDLIANAYNALGTIHDEQGDLDRALHFYRQAEEHLEARADPVLLAGVKDHIGIVLKKRADLNGALAYSAQACALFETHGDPHHMAIAYMNRAGLLLDLDRGDEALSFALSAHRIFVELGSPWAKKTAQLLRDLGVDPDEADAMDLEDSSS